MLETIRQYAQARSQASGGEENLRSRHLDYYCHLVEECEKGLLGSDLTTWLKLLDSEKDNVYAALAWAVQEKPGNGDIALQIAGGLWMWWLARGALSEGRQWLNKALESGLQRASPRAKALVSAGVMTWQQGDYPEASHYLDESISILHELEQPDLDGLANATHMFGHTALDLADYPAANKAFMESLELYQKLNNQYYVGTLISDLGMVAYHQGDYRSARAHQEKSLEVFQLFGNSDVISQTLHRIGELARLEGDYQRAGECYEICLHNYREVGMKLEIASNLHKLGFIAQHYNDFQKARSLFDESLSIQRETGNKQGIAECLASLAGLAAVTSQPTRALRLFSAAQTLLDTTRAPLAPADLVEWKRDQAIARAQLDDAACIQAQAEGRAMGLEQAIAYALETTGVP
jgi:tetratricopeptide (TPR) repeat protein